MLVLEPSAGKGNIADIIRDQHGTSIQLHTIERCVTLSEILRLKGFEVVGADFIEDCGRSDYDRVVMNPPFEDSQDIQHVMHAYDRLKPGGRLVSIMSPGPFFRQDKSAPHFDNGLKAWKATWRSCPSNPSNPPNALRVLAPAWWLLTRRKADMAKRKPAIQIIDVEFHRHSEWRAFAQGIKRYWTGSLGIPMGTAMHYPLPDVVLKRFDGWSICTTMDNFDSLYPIWDDEWDLRINLSFTYRLEKAHAPHHKP
jgi:hypothetical protein